MEELQKDIGKKSLKKVKQEQEDAAKQMPKSFKKNAGYVE